MEFANITLLRCIESGYPPNGVGCGTSHSHAIVCPYRRKKRGPLRPRFLQQEKRRGKNEKEGKNLYYINARSDIRAAVCVPLDLYGFIITFNC
jgi:hypothetical protein